LNVLAWMTVWDLSRARFLEVNFFDVGQGDAIFIESPKRHQILIDGGPSSVILEKLEKEIPFWDNTIDLVILSHPERDHLLGLMEVLKRYKIENILWTGIIRDTAEFKEWEKLIKEEGAQIKIAQAGQKINWSRKWSRFDIDQYMEILYPFKNLENQKFENSNDTSIVCQLIIGENNFLFTGDITQKVEKEILSQYISLDSDVLKVAHHGSKTSSGEEFIARVLPEIAVIQVGENTYGHPHPEVLSIFEKTGTRILRTDKDGDIKIISDGKYLKIKTP